MQKNGCDAMQAESRETGIAAKHSSEHPQANLPGFQSLVGGSGE